MKESAEDKAGKFEHRVTIFDEVSQLIEFLSLKGIIDYDEFVRFVQRPR